jgi:hypothetical protein
MHWVIHRKTREMFGESPNPRDELTSLTFDFLDLPRLIEAP